MSSNGHRLVLFDIDGTLLTAGRVARDAILRSLKTSFGWSYTPDHEDRGKFDFSGKTDPQRVGPTRRTRPHNSANPDAKWVSSPFAPALIPRNSSQIRRSLTFP